MKTYNEITAKVELDNLANWTFKNDGIEKQFEFTNFIEALAFIVKIGTISEKENHHPELFNVYNKVTLRWSTHDADGVTDKDFKLAKISDGLFKGI